MAGHRGRNDHVRRYFATTMRLGTVMSFADCCKMFSNTMLSIKKTVNPHAKRHQDPNVMLCAYIHGSVIHIGIVCQCQDGCDISGLTPSHDTSDFQIAVEIGSAV